MLPSAHTHTIISQKKKNMVEFILLSEIISMVWKTFPVESGTSEMKEHKEDVLIDVFD